MTEEEREMVEALQLALATLVSDVTREENQRVVDRICEVLDKQKHGWVTWKS